MNRGERVPGIIFDKSTSSYQVYRCTVYARDYAQGRFDRLHATLAGQARNWHLDSLDAAYERPDAGRC